MDKWIKRRRTVFFIALGIFIASIIGIPIAISMQEVEDPIHHAAVSDTVDVDIDTAFVDL